VTRAPELRTCQVAQTGSVLHALASDYSLGLVQPDRCANGRHYVRAVAYRRNEPLGSNPNALTERPRVGGQGLWLYGPPPGTILRLINFMFRS
jgi:hypothetical protein